MTLRHFTNEVFGVYCLVCMPRFLLFDPSVLKGKIYSEEILAGVIKKVFVAFGVSAEFQMTIMQCAIYDFGQLKTYTVKLFLLAALIQLNGFCSMYSIVGL